MRKSVIALIAVVVLAGAAVAAVPVIEGHAAASIKSEIERAGTAKVDAVSVGLLGRRVTLTNLKSKTAEAELSIGRWEASGLAWPLGELLAGRTPLAGFGWGDPLSAGRVELENVAMADLATGGRWSMDSLLIEGLDLARYDARYDGMFRVAVLTTRAMGALTVRRLEQRNTRVTLPGAGETVGLGSIVLEGYERGLTAKLTMAGADFSAGEKQPAQLSIAETKATKIDFRRTITALSSDKWFPGAPSGRVQIETAKATGFGGELFKRYGISLGEVSFQTAHVRDKVSRTRTHIEGFVLAPPLRGLEGLSLRMALQSMGIKEVKAEFDCYGTEDQGKGELTVDRCALMSPGLGDVELSARIVNADALFWTALDESDLLALQDSTAALGSARLVLTDKSLLERSLRAIAAMSGQPAATLRANWAREVRRYQPAGVLISQSMTQLLDTIARFVEQGGTLVVEAKPEPPVGFDKLEYLLNPGADLVSTLGLKATLLK
ncbi:hypothetical protein [Reyranella soli]|uniref:Dicarboxylate transport domain-containing protein n=1 Tax=Reyranella soli TaxID=1230389 RepID=A0A512N423_9HYPH|nr:hypothetical protein [Reyranella soli]GEP53738.1 hypothetical protein RSO01_09040 [Reyranella soli]